MSPREAVAELGVEVVLEGDVEEHVERIGAALGRDLGDRLADQRLELGLLGELHLDAVPVALEQAIALDLAGHVAPERGAERGIGEDARQVRLVGLHHARPARQLLEDAHRRQLEVGHRRAAARLRHAAASPCWRAALSCLGRLGPNGAEEASPGGRCAAPPRC